MRALLATKKYVYSFITKFLTRYSMVNTPTPAFKAPDCIKFCKLIFLFWVASCDLADFGELFCKKNYYSKQVKIYFTPTFACLRV